MQSIHHEIFSLKKYLSWHRKLNKIDNYYKIELLHSISNRWIYFSLLQSIHHEIFSLKKYLSWRLSSTFDVKVAPQWRIKFLIICHPVRETINLAINIRYIQYCRDCCFDQRNNLAGYEFQDQYTGPLAVL